MRMMADIKRIGTVPVGGKFYGQVGGIYSISGISPAITTSASHGNGMQYIIENEQQRKNDERSKTSR